MLSQRLAQPKTKPKAAPNENDAVAELINFGLDLALSYLISRVSLVLHERKVNVVLFAK